MVNMKKISIIALTILTLGMTSCDMDKMPYDAVPTEEALTTIVGFEEARAGIYSVYLGLTGGSYVLAPEVQADAFNAVADFSNKYGELPLDFRKHQLYRRNNLVELLCRYRTCQFLY